MGNNFVAHNFAQCVTIARYKLHAVPCVKRGLPRASVAQLGVNNTPLSSLHPVWGATMHKMLHTYGVPDMIRDAIPRATCYALARGYAHIAPTGQSINH